MVGVTLPWGKLYLVLSFSALLGGGGSGGGSSGGDNNDDRDE